MKEIIAFLRVEAGKENEILEKLSSLNEVKEACIVFGEYDIIAHFKIDIEEDLLPQATIIKAHRIISEKLHGIEGITDIVFLPVGESFIKRRGPVQVEIPVPINNPTD
ncbi:AsnC family transcriptional regulator [Staphylothermus hellenicus]|uniref:Transcriptional regulator, AsnC family n=1 Tax=Staphylothermus hellenicus (strain DSM 12710 / JCM 10830 / BK20S6-10-b1 / P8) TaxID=591019 RepID=D7D8K7_STAHD|nr:AsnC family transcriptional regulator [Staphylothermus hellenicus]ADI32103.1 hypothetical protein Shell_0998 [Staphylothermus hellenicus DSM 12710]